MNERALLEVIALDAEDAVAAQAGGADRLELVTDMAADGLTPSAAVFTAVRAAVDIPLRVMLRLADGFAAGDAEQSARLVRVARELRAAGADEFVLGFLDPAGGPDLAAVERIVAELDGCRWTFHRAIDRAADRDALRGLLADAPGLDTYLTAGSAAGVDAGLDTLVAEAARRGEPGYAQCLMVGGGLRLDHVPRLRAAGIDAFHIGGAARPEGWTSPVSAAAVRAWRTAVDEPAPQTVPVG
ncbi:copper homeostasis protein CutC [Streptomyces minutiscleroticus]|uniref:Copper homeostasis protein cutC homolog n=1 Tax=Streptomyces minutiscleroticus TaxID=68238 RepID=A0A918NE11_9ACTN|nr:copper homeostasis protein CutC [Streptomyces minutiscleroticus]GGX63456.1 copper homeostasis protein CutC [Streptomyces minutiscleroticus]